MNISSCFSVPDNRLVNPQTEYERDCYAAFTKASTPAFKKKSSPFERISHPQKKNSDIVLDGKSHFNLEETAENDASV